MLFLRIKQCEAAIAGGRLDEAFELLRADDVRSHRRGQELTDLIVKRLVERGRGHLAAGRISAARGDCDKAARLAGNLADVSQLRFAVDRADAGVRERDGAREHVVADARRLLAAGQLPRIGDLIVRAPSSFDLPAHATVFAFADWLVTGTHIAATTGTDAPRQPAVVQVWQAARAQQPAATALRAALGCSADDMAARFQAWIETTYPRR